jgi:uncharacterized membrane protein
MSEPFPPTPPPPPPPGAFPPPPAGGPGTVSQNRNLMIVLSYLWLLFLIPLLVEKDDREVQWHAKNGMLIFGAELVIGIALYILSQIPILGFLGCIVGPFLWLAFLAVAIIAIMKGINGQRLVIPGLSEYADRINI